MKICDQKKKITNEEYFFLKNEHMHDLKKTCENE